MSELTLKMEYCDWIRKDIIEYLLSLKGIYEVKISDEDNEFYIKYNSEKISIKIIRMEMALFINSNTPDLIGFDKHSRKEVNNYIINIKDLCCEYCLKIMNDILLLVKGVESASNDFDYTNKNEVKLMVSYDSKLITEEEIKKLENKLNAHDFS